MKINSEQIKVNSIFFNPQFYMHNFALSVFFTDMNRGATFKTVQKDAQLTLTF